MLHDLYAKISPNQQFYLTVAGGHQLFVQSSGNIYGIPVIYLHGGPGGGSSADHRRYFNPEKYHIIQFDQRGCGQSKPSPAIKDNTLVDLIADIEQIRAHFAIDKWLVCGGSWGTTLAIAYGIAHYQHIYGFILRGIFLATQAEYDWLYSDAGAARFFPAYYRDFCELLPPEDLNNPLFGYQKLLTSDNELLKISASRAWYTWETRLSSIEHSGEELSHITDPHQAICMAQLSNHYFVNHCFVQEQELINNIDKISHLPAVIIHGRYDMVCQLYYADLLANIWQNAQLQILPHAGHSGFERQTVDAFCKATDTMANFIEKQNG